ncbi:MAG: DUF2268 domain-containing putative Zn-dependent protease [Pseudomonadota bacterium]
MSDAWQIHWLEASGTLVPWHETILVEVNAAKAMLAAVLRPPRLDILVQRNTRVIQEIGMVGHAHHSTLFSLSLDPDNPAFEAGLQDATLRRQVIHEAHHCLRMAGPGYGRSLGEALVSEGLAGQFVRRMFNNPPEPWETAVEPETLRTHTPSPQRLAAETYDHGAWFFGTGELPRWLGYSLGYRMAAEWVDAAQPTPERMVGVPATEVLCAWTDATR